MPHRRTAEPPRRHPRTSHVIAIVVIATGAFACRDMTSLAPTAPTRDVIPSTTRVLVMPGAMQGWAFYDDQHDTTCTVASVCSMVQGPVGAPLATGSAELATNASSDGKSLALSAFKGVRFDSITSLGYATYRQTADAGNNLAIALQINVDYDVTDQSAGYQGRLVFEPYQGTGGNVIQGAWQRWDAKAGKWWGTRVTVPKGNVATANPCVQASPCSWQQLLAAFPDLGVHGTYGALVFKAGSGWSSSFRGNVDSLSITVGSATTLYDFELAAPVVGAALIPDSVPAWIYADTNLVDGATTIAGRLAKNVVMVAFDPGTR